MTELNSYLRANRAYIFVCLVLVNVLLIVAAENTKLKLLGRIETLEHKWSSYATFHQSNIETLITYSKLADTETDYKHIKHQYLMEKTFGNKYISIEKTGPVTARYNRVYYLDDICSLSFSGRADMTVENVLLHCLY